MASTTSEVPPLELFLEEKDRSERESETPLCTNNTNDNPKNNKSIVVSTNQLDNEKSDDQSDNSKFEISDNGRILESEQDWEKRAKITYSDKKNPSEMVFRPLRMKCTHCSEAYTKTHDLYAHIRSHQHHTKCPHCGKILTCMATFVYHVRTHTAEKPYYCPMDGCEFKNAVKYNLKVHLACIRHGGKNNLKKYAKVLDLDVCEKSLRKRKDNSVHELGSRRSKKRRRMNNNNNHNNHRNNSDHNHSRHNMHRHQSHHYNDYNDYMQQTNMLKEDDYDQFAAQLLFSLGNIHYPQHPHPLPHCNYQMPLIENTQNNVKVEHKNINNDNNNNNNNCGNCSDVVKQEHVQPMQNNQFYYGNMHYYDYNQANHKTENIKLDLPPLPNYVEDAQIRNALSSLPTNWIQ